MNKIKNSKYEIINFFFLTVTLELFILFGLWKHSYQRRDVFQWRYFAGYKRCDLPARNLIINAKNKNIYCINNIHGETSSKQHYQSGNHLSSCSNFVNKQLLKIIN